MLKFANIARSNLLRQMPQRSFASVATSSKIKLVEVGPRDGLQNEKQVIPSEVKIELINKLSNVGLTSIEATSFVSPKWVPQMADARQVLTSITQKPDISYPVLAPNVKGLEAAIEAGAKEVAVFSAASETFNKKNTNCTLEESMKRVEAIMEVARQKNVKIRGYVSCVVGCPYEGPVSPQVVADMSKRLLDMGCYEVSLGDTIGVGTPGSIAKMLEAVLKVAPVDKLAVHTHDTYGQALANILCSLDYGIRTFDSSIAGLGGCPYAPGAKGNVATEDVVYMLHGSGYDTGINLEELIHIGDWISQKLGRPTGSRAGSALLLAEQRQQQLKAKL
ncbi:hypothetical protein NQZ79_g900 [Umbelopsis isabellina]|nr:hypothetical protein NQZ79_g900 [Umbelopsis isabellina]